MSDFAIIPDSACDFTKDIRDRFGIDDYVAGALVFPDGHVERADLDWKNISHEDFFASIKENKKTPYKTSFANPQEVAEVFEKYLKDGRDVLSIVLSSGLSGTYSSFKLAADSLMEKYPDRKVIVVDSLKYSSAIGLLAICASRMRAEGKTIDETAAWLEENKSRLHQMGVLDDLFFCSRMKRVSNAAAIGGTLVGIKPLADFDRQGLSHIIGKAKGTKGAYRAIIGYMKATIENPGEQTIIIDHSIRAEEAEAVKALVEENFRPKEIIITKVGQSCGPTIGPGLYTVFYFGKEISEDMSEEKAILSEVLLKK